MNKPSFTRGEYWLLESAVQMTIPLYLLVSDDLEVALNKAGHDMPRDDLIESLSKLYTQGLIDSHSRDEVENGLIFDSHGLETILAKNTNTGYEYYYGLSGSR